LAFGRGLFAAHSPHVLRLRAPVNVIELRPTKDGRLVFRSGHDRMFGLYSSRNRRRPDRGTRPRGRTGSAGDRQAGPIERLIGPPTRRDQASRMTATSTKPAMTATPESAGDRCR
jgi:hypothetical protein